MKKVLYCLLTAFFLLPIVSVHGSISHSISGTILTISGSGAMPDYTMDGSPWEEEMESITEVIINDGITHIGENAFFEAKNLATITIPTSVISIGRDAFGSCLKMANVKFKGSTNEWASIDFENNVAAPFWDSNAPNRHFYFYGSNTATTVLVLTPGITEVKAYAFANANKLTDINIPGSVSYIGAYAFRCSVSTTVCVNRFVPPVTAGKNSITYGGSAKLYVPTGSKSAYVAAGMPWKYDSGTYGLSSGAIYEQNVSGSTLGTYGANVEWELGEDGVLTLDASDPSASKNITIDAASTAKMPWYYFRRLVHKIELKGEITAINNTLHYHYGIFELILNQNTIPTVSATYIATSGSTAYSSLFNPRDLLTLRIKLSTLLSPSETAKLESAPWNDGHWVVAIDEEVVIDENSTDNMELLEAVRTYVSTPVTIQLQRSVSNAYYNTFCSPIDLTAEQVENTFGTGTLIHALASTTYDAGANELTLNFADSQDFMEAGVPYLFQPANNVVNPVFNNVDPASVADAEGAVNASHVVFRGTLEPRDVTTDEIAAQNFIFLQADNHLNWANSGTLKGMRAYWLLKEGVPAHALARRPVMRIGSAATRIGEVPDNNEQCTKVLRDGQVIIIRDGKEYNIMGISL